MDNLTHTLVGAALADAGLKKHTRLAVLTLVLAANAPDVDIVSYAWGGDAGLGFRRGWTHGVLALLVLPTLVTLVVLGWHWTVRRVRGDRAQAEGKTVSPKALLTLAALGVATHPLLDWLNTYGVRWLMPFDGRWFYGDTLFIIDPWLWLLLGGSLFLSRSRSWWVLSSWAAVAALATVVVLGPAFVPASAQVVWLVGILVIAGARAGIGSLRGRNAQRVTIAALSIASVYVITMGLAGRAAARNATRELTMTGHGPVTRIMAGPLPADPFGRDIVASIPGAYWTGSFRWQRDLSLIAGRAPIPRIQDSPVVRAALVTPEAQTFLAWARFPFIEVDTTLTGYTVFLLDARYTRTRTDGFGSLAVVLDQTLSPVSDRPN